MKKLIKYILPNRILENYRSYIKKQEQHKKNALIKGNQVCCPICRSSYREFGEFGIVKRSNARCYNCGSLERHRLLYLYLHETTNFFNKSIAPIRLLHFAPEMIFYEKFEKNKSIIYTPCDLFPDQYKYEGEIKVSKVDITNISFQDGSFDFILCNHVLEHIPDDNLALKELYRVMATNGNGIFQVPIDYSRSETYEDWSIVIPEDREKAFGQKDHVRWYGQDYKDRLKKVGFIVNEIDYPSNFSSNDIFKFGLMKSEKIYHVKK